MTITQRMTPQQAIDFLESIGVNLQERLPMGLATSRQVMELFTECAKGVFMPQQFASVEQWERCHHQDLERLTDKQLWCEVERAKWLMVWHEDAGEWVEERLHICQAEIAKRQKKAKATK